jgi:hypothetical protein
MITANDDLKKSRKETPVDCYKNLSQYLHAETRGKQEKCQSEQLASRLRIKPNSAKNHQHLVKEL